MSNLSITGRYIKLTPDIKSYLESKFDKLPKLRLRMLSPHFVLEKNKHECLVEARVHTPKKHLVVSYNHKDIYLAINALFAKLSKNIKRQASKHKNLRFNKIQPNF